MISALLKLCDFLDIAFKGDNNTQVLPKQESKNQENKENIIFLREEDNVAKLETFTEIIYKDGKTIEIEKTIETTPVSKNEAHKKETITTRIK